MKSASFNDALEVVESLPEDQKESLLEIVRNRLIEQRRDRLALSIKKAKKENAKGDIRRGTVEDLMREVSR